MEELRLVVSIIIAGAMLYCCVIYTMIYRKIVEANKENMELDDRIKKFLSFLDEANAIIKKENKQ